MRPAKSAPSTHPARLVLAVVAGVVLLVVGAWFAVSRKSPLELASSCDGESARVAGKASVCTFDDEFDGTALDPAKWQVLSTPRVGFHSGFECFVDNGQHVDVGGGTLHLTLAASTAGTGCRRLGLPYESGMVLTKGRFAQTYGRFTIRAKLPATPGVQPALWLYPRQLTYGHWPRSGEIDIAEVFGVASQTWPHLHYLGPAGQLHPGRACSVTPNASGFHTYSVDWTPAAFTFRYDGVRCVTIARWTPAPPLAAPAPFDKPFFILLELATGSGVTAPSPTMPLPQAMQVDYVRVWSSVTKQ
jgi:beta-glucanase (GH16 family)